MEGFCDRVQRREKHTVLCVGLDTGYNQLPGCMKIESERARSVNWFNRGVVDRTRTKAAAYKLNQSYYLGSSRQGALVNAVEYIRKNAPHVPIILDAKYADIEDTNKEAAQFAFDQLNVDAVTVMHTPGEKGLEPFLERAKTDGKGVIVVCRMSHPGAREFYDDIVGVHLSEEIRAHIPENVFDLRHGPYLFVPLYVKIALTVAWDWNVRYGNCALVMGCTDDESAHHLKFVRSLVGDLLILSPGLGAQGKGTLKEQAVRLAHAARTVDGGGFLACASRSICRASSGEDWQEAMQRVAIKHNDELNIARMQDIPIPERVERPEFLRTRARRVPLQEPFIT
jgi:orotidine-5'-phosphate decarboxylase